MIQEKDNSVFGEFQKISLEEKDLLKHFARDFYNITEAVCYQNIRNGLLFKVCASSSILKSASLETSFDFNRIMRFSLVSGQDYRLDQTALIKGIRLNHKGLAA